MNNTDSKFRKSNRVLLDERPLVLLPTLAKAVGVNGAHVIQQLNYYLADPNNGKVHDGERWIFKSYDDWQKNDFPFWSVWQIQKTFLALESKKLILSCQPEGRMSRRKYYRIDYDVLNEAVKAATPPAVKATRRARARAEHAVSARSNMQFPHVSYNRDNSSQITHSFKKEHVAQAQHTPQARRVCSFLEEYSEEEARMISVYHALCDNDRRWKRITRYTETVSNALAGYNLESLTELCQAALNEDGDCYIPKRRTLVRLIWDNY